MIIREARKFSKEMTEKYGLPSLESTEFVKDKALELADKLDADKKVVEVGTYLIDIALGKAIKEKRIEEHTRMGSEVAKEFLNRFDLSDEFKEKVINCVEAHHGTVEHTCIESEIVKNADNFRFLNPRGILLVFIFDIGRKSAMSFEDSLKAVESKVEEKRRLVSLDICKQEAEENYRLIREFLERAKKT